MSGFVGAGNGCLTSRFNGYCIGTTISANPGSGFASTVTVNVADAVLPFTSVAVSVYVAVAYVPRSCRVVASNDSPAGPVSV